MHIQFDEYSLGGTVAGYRSSGRGLSRKPTNPVLDKSHPLARGLVGWWAFDRPSGATVADLVGSNDATVNGGSFKYESDQGPVWANSSSYLQTDAISALQTPAALSIFMRFRCSANDLYGTLFNIGGGANHLWWEFAGDVGYGYVAFYNGSLYLDASDTTNLRDGEWHDLVVTWDGSALKTYADTVEIGSVSTSGTLSTTGEVTIGALHGGSNIQSDLEVADARVWDRSLSAAEILYLYHYPWGPCIAEERTVVVALPSTVPDTPTGIAASALAATATVRWDTVPGAANYGINRQKDSGGYSRLATVAHAPRGLDAGLNAISNNYYAGEVVWTNSFHKASEWVDYNIGTSTFDSNGWPTSVSGTSWLEILLFRDIGGYYPTGSWQLTWEGNGTLSIASNCDAENVVVGSNVIDFDVNTSTDLGITIRIEATDPAPNNVRNLKLVHSSQSAVVDTQLVRDDWVAMYEDFGCIRFMDLLETNNSDVVSWDDRKKETDALWGGVAGIPMEAIAEMANRTKCDAWLCIPHKASDSYVTSMAEFFLANLNYDINVYIEFSNECWNYGFSQTSYCVTQGLADSEVNASGGSDGEKGLKWYSKRAQQCFDLWDAVWTGRDAQRVKHVLGCQAANTAVATVVLGWDAAATKADAIAGGFYFGNELGDPANESTVEAWTLTQLFSELNTTSVPGCITNIQNHKTIADANSLELWAYEGGQHLVGYLGVENNSAITTLFTSANRDSRMGDIYDQFLLDAASEGVTLFAHFSSTGAYVKWGSWGIYEYWGQSRASSPKADAILSYVESNGVQFYEDEGLDPAVWDYTIAAIDALDVESDPSSSVQVTITSSDLIPYLLTATKDGVDVDLAWSTLPGADSYIVQRSPNGTDTWTQIATPTSASATDTNPGTGTWYYRVAAVVDAITGDWSDTTSVTYLSANTNTATASITLPSLGITASAEVSSSPGQTEISATADITLPSLGITASATNETLTLPGIPSSINVYLESPNIKIEWGAATSAVSYTVEMDLASSGYSELSSGITSPLSATVAYPGVGTQRFRVYATNPNGNGGTIQGFLYTAPVTPTFTGTGRGFLGKSLLELKLSL